MTEDRSGEYTHMHKRPGMTFVARYTVLEIIPVNDIFFILRQFYAALIKQDDNASTPLQRTLNFFNSLEFECEKSKYPKPQPKTAHI